MSHPGMAPVVADARRARPPASTMCRSRSRWPGTGCCSSPSRCPKADASSVASTWRTSGRPDDAVASPDVAACPPVSPRRPRQTCSAGRCSAGPALAPRPHGHARSPCCWSPRSIVAHGCSGPQLAPTNLATLLTWIHYRGLLIGALLVAGNLFCAACPMILVRDLARRVHSPSRHWPRWLRRKWVGARAVRRRPLRLRAVRSLGARPARRPGWWSAISAPRCSSTRPSAARPSASTSARSGSSTSWRRRCRRSKCGCASSTVCQTCTTVDCIKGRARCRGGRRSCSQRGCELALFQPTKVGNLDCTFCLDCVHACPHDNVAHRLPRAGRRAGGRPAPLVDRAPLTRARSRRARAGVHVRRDAERVRDDRPGLRRSRTGSRARLGTSREAPVLGLVFVMALGVIPLALCAGAAVADRPLRRHRAARSGTSPCVTHTRWCRSAPASGSRTTASISSPGSAPSCR